jgi:hypothetical protein
MVHDLCDLPHCQQHCCAEHLDAVRLAADPAFSGSLRIRWRLWRDLRSAYPFREALRLWLRASLERP